MTSLEIAEKYGIDLYQYGKVGCPKCMKKGMDGTGDNLMVYGVDDIGRHKGAHCFGGCGGFDIPSEEWLEENGVTEEKEYNIVGAEFNDEIHAKMKEVTTTDSKGYRGIRKDTTAAFGVRHEMNTQTGEVAVQYYPCTMEADNDHGFILTGYKKRTLPKDFKGALGETGRDCQLFGQFKFLRNRGKFVVIVGGEVDQLSAFQMLGDYQKGRGYEAIPVVSPTIGETGCEKQIVKQYEWFNRFERIIVCMDNDQAGREATDMIVKALPKDKVYLMEMDLKDPNEYLKQGREKVFVDKFFKAVPYTPNGIVGSGSLSARMKEAVLVPKVPLPPFMKKVQKMMAGGIPLGRIVNLGSASGCVDKDTEYLTPTGWKKFDQYSEGDLVGQYHEDGSMSFVEPLEYVKRKCEEMTHFSNRSTDQVLSDEHRVVYYSQAKGGKPRIKPFKEVKEQHAANSTGFRGHFATTFDYSGTGIDFTEGELRLQVAVMADGRIVREGKDNYTQMRFNKERKYLRLLDIVVNHNLKYSDRGMGSDGYYEIIVWPKTQDKNFSEKFYSASKKQMEIITDEVMFWDGYAKNQVYTSCRKGDVDFLQFAYAVCGKRSVVGEDSRTEKYKDGYCGVLSVNKGGQRVSIRRVQDAPKTEMKPYKTLDGFKYCFMVETGMLVLRRNGRVFITGNTGKSTIVDECVYYWVFHSPHHIGVVSLESDVAEYGIKVLSRHIGRKIDLIEDPQEKYDLLCTPEVEAAQQNLFFREDGTHRWHLMDERDGGLDDLKAKIMELVISCECKVIILDPLQDILDGMSNEEQAVFMRWQKGLTKSHKITFININHVRKSGQGGKQNSTGAELFEEDFQGSSSIFKSGACNLLFMRDKGAECDIMRNITRMKMTKCRWTGNTAPKAGEYFYDNDTHTIHDLEDYLDRNPEANKQYQQSLAAMDDGD